MNKQKALAELENKEGKKINSVVELFYDLDL